MEENELYKSAIVAMEYCTSVHKVSFQIHRNALKKNLGKTSGQWIVIALGKRFMDKDFLRAVAEAVQFVLRAYGDQI